MVSTVAQLCGADSPRKVFPRFLRGLIAARSGLHGLYSASIPVAHGLGTMNWIIEHLWLFVVATVVLAFYLSRRNSSHRGAKDDRPPGPIDPKINDAVQAERTRRVREEIARKIAERKNVEQTSGQPPVLGDKGGPLMTPPTIRPIDPFGGPTRRFGARILQAIRAFFRK
jgi:hypothetical protein